MVKDRKGRYRNGSLRYTIRPIQDAIDYFDEQQIRKLQAKMARRNAGKGILGKERESLFESNENESIFNTDKL